MLGNIGPSSLRFLLTDWLSIVPWAMAIKISFQKDFIFIP